jgi:hypothetical protein
MGKAHRVLCRQDNQIPIGNYDGILVPTRTQEAARLESGLPVDCRLLVRFGYQRPRKGLEVALDAMRWLDRNFHLSGKRSSTAVAPAILV